MHGMGINMVGRFVSSEGVSLVLCLGTRRGRALFVAPSGATLHGTNRSYNVISYAAAISACDADVACTARTRADVMACTARTRAVFASTAKTRADVMAALPAANADEFSLARSERASNGSRPWMFWRRCNRLRFCPMSFPIMPPSVLVSRASNGSRSWVFWR